MKKRSSVRLMSNFAAIITFAMVSAAPVAAQTCTSITRDDPAYPFQDFLAGAVAAGRAWGFVVSPSNCAWTVTNDNPGFLTVASPLSGVGNGILVYNFTANNGPAARRPILQ